MKQITHRVGQVWRDNDPRMRRYVKIEVVEEGRYLYVRRCTPDGDPMPCSPLSRILAARFHHDLKPRRTGFTLVLCEHGTEAGRPCVKCALDEPAQEAGR